MTKTQVIRLMAEQMNVSPKLVTGFFDLLIRAATSEMRKAGEFTIPGLGKLVRLSVQPGRAATRALASQSRSHGQDDRQFRVFKAARMLSCHPRST